nr:hypothetical protein [Tanacetum cinerariifolium]
GYALKSTARILNMVPTKKVERTPYEIWHEKAPKLSYSRVWGCESLMKRDTPNKLDPRYIKCIFVGYPKETMGHYLYYPLENKIFVARNIESARIPQASDRYGFYVDVEEYELVDLNEPPNYKAALSDPKFNKWLEAMNKEMQSMKDNQMENSKKGYTSMIEKPDYRKSQGAKTPSEQNPGEIHRTAIKAILMYLRDTKDMVLVYGAKPKAEPKSAKQSTTAISSTEAEYIDAAEASMEAIWMRKFIDGLGGVVPLNKRPTKMLCDNLSWYFKRSQKISEEISLHS